MRIITTLLFALFSFALVAQEAEKTLQELFSGANAAYEKEDYKVYLDNLRQIDERRPNYPIVVYKLAGAYALNKRKARSVQKLRQYILMDATAGFEEDKDFDAIRKYKGYKRLVALKEALGKKEVHDEVFRTIDVGLIHPESFVLLDDGTILMSSVREKKIVKIDQDNNVSDWLETDLAVMGMEVHKGYLWAATAAIDQMEGYTKEMAGRSLVLQINLETGGIVQGLDYDENSLIGDIELDNESRIWVSNSMTPFLGRDNTDTTDFIGGFMRKNYDLELTHFNIQGLTLNDDQSALYFADYVNGIHKVNVETDDITPVFAPNTSLLKGIDGLYHYKSSLIAIHNGVKPFRVIQYFLDETGDNILMERIINRGGESLGEPTNGLIKDGYFYYLANSPWPAYDENMQIDPAKVKPIEIRRIKLD